MIIVRKINIHNNNKYHTQFTCTRGVCNTYTCWIGIYANCSCCSIMATTPNNRGVPNCRSKYRMKYKSTSHQFTKFLYVICYFISHCQLHYFSFERTNQTNKKYVESLFLFNFLFFSDYSLAIKLYYVHTVCYVFVYV